MRRTRNRLRTGNEGWLTSYADLMTNLLIFFALIVGASEVQTGRMDRIISRLSGDGGGAGTLGDAKKVVEQTIKNENLQKEVSVEMTDAGLELSFNSGVTFDSGEATVKASMLGPLNKVLTSLKGMAGKYRFAVEGHTDSVPIGPSSNFKSNWELSSARSLAVRERLESLGFPRDRIRVEAYADTRPLEPALLHGLSSEEVLARSRRVVVRLY